MPSVNPDCYHLSASSISSFKACPTRFRLAYREGLRPVEDTDSQRVGTNWHKMHEIYYAALQNIQFVDPASQKRFALDEVISHLNQQYSEKPKPTSKTLEEWEVERQQLMVSFIGYLWYWENDSFEVIASEVEFTLPLHMPTSGMPLPLSEVARVGKIDHLIRWQGMVGPLERKSTSRSIDPSSDYWERGQKDTQVSMYALACRELEIDGVQADERFGNTLYDVWHKPTIKPAKLTQADTRAFLEGHTYYDHECNVNQSDDQIEIDGWPAEIIEGKTANAIRETPNMYGARLLADIQERPEFYFQRKEIARSDQDLKKFRAELYHIYQAQRMYEQDKCWFENEQQCRATFPCAMIPICYGPGADTVCDGNTIPNGFKRIFVDEPVEEQD